MIRACCLLCLVWMSLGQRECLAQTPGNVPTSLAWDVASDPRNAALGGLDAAPLSGDGWSMTVHPCALDSSVERQVYTSYLDYFAGIKAASVAVPISTSNRRSSYVGMRFVSWGEFEGANAAGIPTGTFSGGDYIPNTGALGVSTVLGPLGSLLGGACETWRKSMPVWRHWTLRF